MHFSFRDVFALPLASWIVSFLVSNVKDSRSCKTIPGDATWPSDVEWSNFNESIGGRLIKTIPIAQSCHTPHYDESNCAQIRAQWHLSTLHSAKSSSSMMTPFFANLSCDPFTRPDDPCVLGTYVQYAVNVSRPVHIYKTLDFVKKHNIRFVVRNTGHDYMGKSTGANALAIWTHFLQKTYWIENFVSPSYRGVAVKAQAGVEARILYEQADRRGFAIVGGECPSVGIAGGYTQGGGHSILGSMYGLAADQTLSFEVITTQGEFLVASPTQNHDLYWALSGGGGGTYGIVWSVTLKAYKDVPVTVASVDFTSHNLSTETFWAGINAYHASTLSYTAAGGFALAGYTTTWFRLKPLALPGLTPSAAALLLQPLLTRLDTLGIEYTSSVTTHPGFLNASQSVGTLEDYGVGMWHFGGRLLPGSLWADPDAFRHMTSVIRDIIEDGGIAFDVAIRPSLEVAGNPDNAVLPAWRDTERLFIPMLVWDDYATWPEILQTRDKVTWKFGEPLRQLAPDSGAYLNEADTSEPNWKTAFYGENYARLLAIKDYYDPAQLLYGSTAVGGDRWVEVDEGRLCPV
ncbi:FAD binding domain protein [Mycena venus]|uniref:FAD binding domain protein n=1 Tax=Mycena venus TaxID=2733690 RepID=A0A8H7CP30_9AGAR|nr:FAD binding domain protein [Mycena venus]